MPIVGEKELFEALMLAQQELKAERAKVAALEAEVKIAEAKGWRDAVSCVQYCAANWSQDCRSEAERNALEDTARQLVNELVAASPSDWLETEWQTAQDYSDIIAKLEAENAALFKQANDMSWQVDQSGQMMEKLETEAAHWREVAEEAHTLTVYHADYVTGENIKRQHINRAARVLSNRVRSLIDVALKN